MSSCASRHIILSLALQKIHSLYAGVYVFALPSIPRDQSLPMLATPASAFACYPYTLFPRRRHLTAFALTLALAAHHLVGCMPFFINCKLSSSHAHFCCSETGKNLFPPCSPSRDADLAARPIGFGCSNLHFLVGGGILIEVIRLCVRAHTHNQAIARAHARWDACTELALPASRAFVRA